MKDKALNLSAFSLTLGFVRVYIKGVQKIKGALYSALWVFTLLHRLIHNMTPCWILITTSPTQWPDRAYTMRVQTAPATYLKHYRISCTAVLHWCNTNLTHFIYTHCHACICIHHVLKQGWSKYTLQTGTIWGAIEGSIPQQCREKDKPNYQQRTVWSVTLLYDFVLFGFIWSLLTQHMLRKILTGLKLLTWTSQRTSTQQFTLHYIIPVWTWKRTTSTKWAAGARF